MVRFSQAVEYGLLGLIELARSKTPLSLSEIAKQANIPENFLAKIFQKLQKEKFITSKRGKNGGFTFPKKSLEKTVWEVYSIIEGAPSLQICVGEDAVSCGRTSAPCTLRIVWNEAQKSLEKALKKWSIQDLLAT